MIIAKSFLNKTVAVLGLARSGRAAISSLTLGGAKVLAWDDDRRRREEVACFSVEISDLYNVDLAPQTTDGRTTLSVGVRKAVINVSNDRCWYLDATLRHRDMQRPNNTHLRMHLIYPTKTKYGDVAAFLPCERAYS